MGLDGYLVKRRFIWSNERENIRIEGLEGIEDMDLNDLAYIEFHCIHWHDAYAINKWFEDNCCYGEGFDNINGTYIDISYLDILFETLEKILSYNEQKTIDKNQDIHSKMMELLPFPEYIDFNEKWYLDDVKYTYDNLKKVLDNHMDYFDYYYRFGY